MDRSRIYLTNQLVSELLKGCRPEKIAESTNLAQDMINAPIYLPKSHNSMFWYEKWKSKIEESNLGRLYQICSILPIKTNQLLRLLDYLAFSPKESNYISSESQQTRRKYLIELSEKDIVSDLLLLLQDGVGNKITIESDKFIINGSLTMPQKTILLPICKLILCERTVSTVFNRLKGSIGRAIGNVLEEERQNFIFSISQINPETTTLLGLNSILQGNLYEHMFASSLICNYIQQPNDDSLFNSLSYSYMDGTPYVLELGKKMISKGMEIFCEFVRDWVLFGSLDDPHNEFFIEKQEGKFESGKWWKNRYIEKKNRIPIFLQKDPIIKQILSSGKSWNFIRKFKPQYLYQLDRITEWTGQAFDLSMVPKYSRHAMDAMMFLMMNTVWIPGHMKVIYDFLLFSRGEFASAIFKTFSTKMHKDDGASLLKKSLKAVTNGLLYTNPETGENLLDKIDLQIKNIALLSPQTISLSYKVEAPEDAILDEASISRYLRMSQLIWKLKCIEMQLSSNWKIAQKAENLSDFWTPELLRNLDLCRHIMLFTVHSITEYFQLDIILCRRTEFEQQMENEHDFDQLFRLHRTHIKRLMTGLLLSSELKDQYGAFGDLITTCVKFINFESDISRKIDDILDNIANCSDFDENFIDAIREDVEEIGNINREMIIEFQNCVEILYNSLSDAPNVLELKYLELRLRFVLRKLFEKRKTEAAQ